MHRAVGGAVGVAALTLAAAWLVVTAGPTFSQSPNGSVTASVTVNIGPCISIANSTFSYNPATFSPLSGPVVTTLPSGTKPVVTNCSNQAENIVASGGSATAPGVTWALQGATLNCAGDGPNKYRHEIKQTSTNDYMALTGTNQTWESAVAAGATKTVDGRLTMPCSGSDGGGATLSIPISLTAVIGP